jgi:transcriptional regulator with PAS, ATPase and Fis domain
VLTAEPAVVKIERPILLGMSAAMIRLREEVEAASRSDAKVLIAGETGVGKEIVARMVHDLGKRRASRFITINCAGVPDSLLESELFGHVRGSFTGAYRDRIGLAVSAHNGTLFLDELGEMSLRMQALLLRFTETGEIQRVGADRSDGHVDVRIIAATNRNLLDRIAAREFRDDLYYRLNVIRLTVPPLRDRAEDIPLLLQHFLELYSRTHSMDTPVISPAAVELLVGYSWPGNVRELRNVVERFVIRNTKGLVQRDDLPAEILNARPPAESASATGSGNGQPPREPSRTEMLWNRIVLGGESFWNVVYPTFIDRELTKTDLRQLIRQGLEKTQGSYRRLVEVFNMAPGDYKRFLAFLYQHDCHLPFHGFRESRSDQERVARN